MLLKNTAEICEDEKDTLRKDYRSFHASACEFAREYGRSFADLVLSRRAGLGTTNIAICCNGAEHLGTLLEYCSEGLADINFRYLFLTKKVVESFGLKDSVNWPLPEHEYKKMS